MEGERMIKCPLCQNSSNRVIFRPHWSKKYHEFICGHCKIVFSLKYDPEMDLNLQLSEALNTVFFNTTEKTYQDHIREITNKINNMTEEEMKERLEELEAIYH